MLVCSVTVTYNPEGERVRQQLSLLAGQVDHMIVVDNGSAPPVQELLRALARAHGTDLTLIPLPRNHGVAHGFNAGIRAAREREAEFALLLDHDSLPPEHMAASLVAGYREAVDAAAPGLVAAVGPRIHDVRDDREYPFIRMGWLRNRHLRCDASHRGVISCDFLISSGTLLPLARFADVGPFDETLFIDSVDLEWCSRARSRGYALFGVCAAQLDHQLGDERRTVLGRIPLVVHSPQRIYYMTRNRVLLYRRAYMPRKWKHKDALRALAKLGALALFVPPRAEYLRMAWRAVRDAFAGRVGPLEGPTPPEPRG